MKTMGFALFVSLAAVGALARPVPLWPITLAPPAPYQPLDAAVEGDDIFALVHAGAALAIMRFHRESGGGWAYAQTIYSDPHGYTGYRMDIDVDGDVLAALFDPRSIAIFERNGGAWTRGVLAPTTDEIDSLDIHVDAGRVVAGATPCTAGSLLIARDSTGVWQQVAGLEGPSISCNEPDPRHRAAALDGDFAVNLVNDGTAPYPELWWYQAGFDWLHYATSQAPASFGEEFLSPGGVAIDGGHVFATTRVAPAVYAFGPDSFGVNEPQDSLRSLDNAMVISHGDLVAADGFVIVDVQLSRTGQEMHVWRKSGAHTFEHVAIARGDDHALQRADVSGHTLVITSTPVGGTRGSLRVFEIPSSLETPDLVQADFQDNDLSQWQLIGGGRLTITRSGHSRVFRQSHPWGDSGGLLTNTDWTNQSVQADVRITGFPAADGFVGIASRYQDFNNYYYLSLRNGNRLALRKKVNGVVSELAGANFPVTPGRTYRLRLDARADDLYAEVDGRVMLHARDGSLKQGAAAFRGYHATYDIDNVLVSPLSTTLYRNDAGISQPAPWIADAGQWTFPSGASAGGPIRQTAYRSAFAVIGGVADDQIVVSRARIDAFNPASTAAWAGVVARQSDIHNQYLLVLRSNDAVQLRKVIGGATTLLAGRALTVVPGRDYLLRLDVTGDRLRGYVDGVLQLETRDGDLARGRAGLATYQAKATYSSYEAYQP